MYRSPVTGSMKLFSVPNRELAASMDSYINRASQLPATSEKRGPDLAVDEEEDEARMRARARLIVAWKAKAFM